MLKQPVAVANPSQFKGGLSPFIAYRILFILCIAATICSPTLAESSTVGGYLARIANDSPEEVANALKRAEELYFKGELPPDTGPIALVLHGPEVEIFFKDKYEKYKETVDLAARLSAFGVVDVRVCLTQTGIMGREPSSIHPFIGTVAFGPSEIKRLLDQQNYVYF